MQVMCKSLSLFFVSVFLSCYIAQVRSDDAETLLALKRSLDPSSNGVLQWGNKTGGDFCQWQGVKQCLIGEGGEKRVSKLVVENLNLNGILDEKSLNQLDQLRVLSFKSNSISGKIPSFSGLSNLKSLYLNNNNLSGMFPISLTQLHRLKTIVLSGNKLSGEIPISLINLPRLYVLFLEDNQLVGKIPPFKQTTLKFLNLSHNRLQGEVPVTSALSKFNDSSFAGNMDLCGEVVHKKCGNIIGFAPSISPSYPLNTGGNKPSGRNRSKKIILIIVFSVVGGFLVLSALIVLLLFGKSRQKRVEASGVSRGKGVVEGGERDVGAGGGVDEGDNRGKQGGFSWDQGGNGGGGDGIGALVFLGPGDEQMTYSLEDLLKASAETLGRGIMGSTYKAVMESGYIVTVKRLKDARYPRLEEFRRHVEILGRLRHPNLVPLRAYFQAKEERLLVFDYFPNGSLFSLIHGSRASGGSKPLHWTSCLKIAEDLATGLLYIHQNPGLTHGNLKSSNVLLGPDFESCLTDYGLTPFRNPEMLEESSASSHFYRAPECRDARRALTQEADVYSFGVLLLELLTGKTPFQDLVQEHGSDIPRWVRSVREEAESGDDPASSGNEASEEKLAALLNIAMSCVTLVPEERPAMREVLRMIRETRAEAQISSNSSDRSPGRWSDTVQSLPREENLSI
ncbi:transmembrane signal receptor [Lithospermum erythrorhizon]|uniref:Transmembrane signal receptor n=1 Tax=Lithospermum erythrorhizon TaxID=34254 RepID=A0AAV3R348_LITER